MGKILSAESIAQNAYPHCGDHEQVAEGFMANAESIPSLHAAIVFGSTALRSTSRRSDVDIAVAHTSENIGGFFDGLQKAFEVLPHGSLIEPHIISEQALREGVVHDGDVFLAEHLRLTAMESPAAGIRPEAFAHMPNALITLPSREALAVGEQVTEKYLHQKVRKFLSASRQGDDPNHSRLQRAFELPTAITRKLTRLEQLREKGHHSAFGTEFYNKASLTSKARLLGVANSDWQTNLTWLIERDNEYSTLLEATISGEVSLRHYEVWLQKVSEPSLKHALRLSIAALAIQTSAKSS